jgi:protein-disulfide isomerase
MALKRLTVVTAILFVFILGTGAYFNKNTLPNAVTVNFDEQPTIGYPKAKVHVVVFKEPKCVNCRDFNLTIYPQLKQNFIDTNKITYTVIPVSFLPGSMPAAIALLCAYYADPTYPNNDLFFTYLDYLYAHQPDERTDWATTEKMLQLAKEASPAIDLNALRSCIEQQRFRTQIEKNNTYGRNLMGGGLSTPTIYVNGIKVTEISYSSIERLINEVLEKEGVHS